MNTTIKIAAGDQLIILDYEEALANHHGSSIWGVAVAFRMLQMGAKFFCSDEIWDRKDIFIISGHPGPGVKDTLEFVTHCVSNNKLKLSSSCKDKHCSKNMKYEWSLFHKKDLCSIKLNDTFVPNEFFEILDRLNSKQEQATDRQSFKKMKQTLCDKIWQENVEESFQVEFNNTDLKKNHIANA